MLRDPDRSTPPIIGEDTGATMVEYGIMLALVALVAVLGVTAFGIEVGGLFDNVDLLNALS